MPRIDFRPRCSKCDSLIPEDELLKPCSVCGFDSLKEAKKENEKRLREMIRIQAENDRRMKDPDYEGPIFGGAVV